MAVLDDQQAVRVAAAQQGVQHAAAPSALLRPDSSVADAAPTRKPPSYSLSSLTSRSYRAKVLSPWLEQKR